MLRYRWVWLLTSAGEQGSTGLSENGAMQRRAQTDETAGEQC